MTVEERAQKMIEDYLKWTNSPSEGKEELKTRFAKHLRDQIEDCAKAVKSHHVNCTSHCTAKIEAQLIAEKVSALASQTDQIEGKEG
jgi:hypothetical protein